MTSRKDGASLFTILAIAFVVAATIAAWIYRIHIGKEIPQQRRVVSQLQTLSYALKDYAGNHGEIYPGPATLIGAAAGQRTFERNMPAVWPQSLEQTVSLLQDEIGEQFADERVPSIDPWGHEILYAVSADRRHFVLISRGTDGVLDSGPVPYAWRRTEAWRDTIATDIEFLSYPYGISIAGSP